MNYPSSPPTAATQSRVVSPGSEADEGEFPSRLSSALTSNVNDLSVFGSEAQHMASKLAIQEEEVHTSVKKQNSFNGVFVPTCENMWGVLIFLRFYTVVGQGGLGHALLAILLSFTVAFCTTTCLSACAASGGMVSEGGPYHMISRALGPYVGASVGLTYWLGITMLAVLECIGAVDALLLAVPELEFSGVKQAIGSGVMLTLAFTVWCGINFVSKLGVVFIVVVLSTIVMYFVGLGVAPWSADALADPRVTGLSMSTLEGNWAPQYSSDYGFGLLLATVFPCFTGILSGANRADVLQNPPKNIRNGTFGAICFSLVMYTAFMVLWAAVAEGSYLRGEPLSSESHRRLSGSSAGDFIVGQIAWPHPTAVYAGIIISSLSQALQCIIVAPRLLRSIANDKLIPALKFCAPLSSRHEPERALLVTYVVGGLLVLIGELDTITPLLTMCFLVCYAFMNFSCLTLTLLRTPTWRPSGMFRKRYRGWYIAVSALGFLMALTVMVIVSLYWALGVLALALFLYLYIDWVGEEAEWGSGMDGVRFNAAINALTGLKEKVSTKKINWRPQILIVYPIRAKNCIRDDVTQTLMLAEGKKDIEEHDLLRLCGQLRKGRGMCVAAAVIEGDRRDPCTSAQASLERERLAGIMEEEQVRGFSDVMIASSWGEGAEAAVQLSGLGGLRPNSVLLCWPTNWKRKPGVAQQFVDLMSFALRQEKAVMCVKNLSALPGLRGDGSGSSLGGSERTIDLWWFIHDGGLLVLLAWLFSQHKMWRGCRVRIFVVMEGVSREDADLAAEKLRSTLARKKLLQGAVEIETIILTDAMLEPYTYDWTFKAEDRRQLMKEGCLPYTGVPSSLDDLFLPSDFDDFALPEAQMKDVLPSPPDSARRLHSRASRMGSIPEAERFDQGQDLSFKEIKSVPPSPSTNNEKNLVHYLHTRCSEKRRELEKTRSVERKASSSSSEGDKEKVSLPSSQENEVSFLSFARLNSVMVSKSSSSSLVLMNLPDVWGHTERDAEAYMEYCESLTKRLEKVIFVHSSGHEIFDMF